jgi:hypothetical protein
VFDAWGFERCLWGTDWTRAFAVVNYEQAVEPFLKTDRLSDSERAMLMGGACAKAYGWSPKNGHRGLLRSAHRHQDREIWLPDRAHARQLPVDGELQPPRRADRSGAREGHHLHRAPGRSAGSAALGLLSEVVEDVTALQQRADELAKLLAGHAPLTLRATKEAMRRLQPRLSAMKARTSS